MEAQLNMPAVQVCNLVVVDDDDDDQEIDEDVDVDDDDYANKKISLSSTVIFLTKLPSQSVRPKYKQPYLLTCRFSVNCVFATNKFQFNGGKMRQGKQEINLAIII